MKRCLESVNIVINEWNNNEKGNIYMLLRLFTSFPSPRFQVLLLRTSLTITVLWWKRQANFWMHSNLNLKARQWFNCNSFFFGSKTGQLFRFFLAYAQLFSVSWTQLMTVDKNMFLVWVSWTLVYIMVSVFVYRFPAMPSIHI